MNSPRFATLAQWLAWQEGLHPRAIDLGLERMRVVLERLGLESPAYKVITVGGTNGKGSAVAFLDAILAAAGYRVGAYTSPHLLRYNERIRVAGVEVSDATLCRAFAAIDAVRGDISLTYFEFGTLAALRIFQEARVQVAVLEVGLGGRLDAVNVLAADAALVTSVAIDHVEWLGPDRDSIGREKAGIYRPGRPAVCADPDPPTSLLEYANAIGATLYRVDKDYGWRNQAAGWTWWQGRTRLESLPLPGLMGEHQFGNAAGALMVLTALSEQVPVGGDAVRAGLQRAHIPARLQIVAGPVEWILDVAHNPHGAAALARALRSRPCGGRTWAVVGMLADKDVAAVGLALQGVVDRWYTATLQGPRGRLGWQLAEALRAVGGAWEVFPFASVAEACRAASAGAVAGDRIVVFGSFHTVAEALVAGVL